MISGFSKTKAGQKVIVLGLSRENVERLTTGGKPMWISASRGHEVPRDTEIVIIFGETEKDIVDGLRVAGVDAPLVDRSGSPS